MLGAFPVFAGAVVLSFLVAAPSAAAPAGPVTPAADCGSGAGEADVNGDGFDDAVVADPDATVNGVAGAGQVHVLYGGAGGQVGQGGAREVLRQGLAGVGETLEANDHFGSRVVLARVDEDVCADLVVGVPYEDLPGAPDAGVAHVIFGSPTGLGDVAPLVLKQGSFDIEGAPEAGDHFGYAVALEPPEGPDGTTVAVGVPGEDVGSLSDAGVVDLVWVSGFSAFQGIAISQNTADVPGATEAGDQFGYSVAVGHARGFADFPDLIAGAPGEDFGSVSNGGSITVVDDVEPFKTDFTGQALTQDSSGVPGAGESGDRFGYSMAYESVGYSGRLAVGAPYENVGSITDAGIVQLFSSPAGTSLTPGAGISQDTSGILGSAEANDRFGSVLATASASVTGGGVHVIVGNPYENVGSVVDAGAVQVLPYASPTSDVAYDENSSGIIGVPQTGDNFGRAVDSAGGTSEGAILIGVPFDATYTSGEAHVIPYGGGPPRQWVPGAGGIPATGATTFGAAVSG